ncbi:MAG: M10 family metallopeptidase C-terminal domain-containing protein, partial [Microcystis panniformis]
MDIVTDKSRIREVEGIVTPITDNGDFSCYSCPVDGFNATIGVKTLETDINITCPFGDDGICATCSCIRNDVIIGGGGEDILNGGLGSDQLTGGEGRDRFVFNTVDEIGQGANQDNILDFNTGLDTIDISGIDANSLNAGNQSFTFIAASDFSGQAGQLRFYGGLLCGDT